MRPKRNPEAGNLGAEVEAAAKQLDIPTVSTPADESITKAERGPKQFTVTSSDDERLTVTVWRSGVRGVVFRLDVYLDPDDEDAWPWLEFAPDAAYALGLVLMMASKRHLTDAERDTALKSTSGAG